MKSNSNIKSILTHWSIVAALGLSTGCSVDNSSTDTAATEEDGEVENIPDTDEFQVMVNTNDNYSVVISRGGDGTTECVAEEGEDILCVVDMYELDMYMRGYTLNDAFPADMCAYRGFYPYFYAIAPIGNAPLAVFYEIDADENITAPTGAGLSGIYDGIDDGGGPMSRTANDADIYYYIANPAGTYGWYAHQELFTQGRADDPADIRCPWDYSTISEDFPNCCYSFWKYSIKTVNSEGEVDESNTNEWDGSYRNCFEGPGIDWEDQSFGLNGTPTYSVTNVDAEDGINGSFPVPRPISISSTFGRPQVYAASFYDPADHGGDIPEMTRLTRSTSFGSNSGLVNGSAHIQYDCLDEAFEVVARIRVVGREWNKYSDFVAFLAGSGDASNADRTGTETEPTQDTGDDTISPALGEVNDFPDWHDVATNEAACEFAMSGSAHTMSHFQLTTAGGSADASDLTFQYSANDYLGFIIDGAAD